MLAKRLVTVIFTPALLAASKIQSGLHSPKCHIAPPNIVIAGNPIPLADQILELISLYGKFTASTTIALDTMRYSGLTTPTEPESQIPVRGNKRVSSGIGILLNTAVHRAEGLGAQLSCIQEALDRRVGIDHKETWIGMIKVVVVLLEELEGTK